jgi:hypothetical protein
MSQRFRQGFTAAEKTELWDRWQRGESLKAIGRALGKPSSSIYFQVAPQRSQQIGRMTGWLRSLIHGSRAQFSERIVEG